MAYKGIYRPKNPGKYKGDPTSIVWRSLWERHVCRYLDLTEEVKEWSSEELIIGYISPLDGKPHRYFPDFLFKIQTSEGLKTYLIEVKPKKQTYPPVKPKRVTKKYVMALNTWAVNQAKWEAAIKFCKKMGWEFKILTEDTLFKDK